MKRKNKQKAIFQQGGKVYYYASRLLSADIRQDTTILYAFLRFIDDLVDSIPPQKEAFYAARSAYYNTLQGDLSDNILIRDFIELSQRKKFDPEWIEAFFQSMEADLSPKLYHSLDEVLPYIKGAAEVIGLFMVKIMELPEESNQGACLLGRAMQYINFIRDIAEDQKMGRRYLFLTSGLLCLTYEETVQKSQEFRHFIGSHSQYFFKTLHLARRSFSFLSFRTRFAVELFIDLYLWTAGVIIKNPLIVWKKKVKPTGVKILLVGIKRLFLILLPLKNILQRDSQ